MLDFSFELLIRSFSVFYLLMSISVTPTAITLASLDRLLHKASSKFDSSHPDSCVNKVILHNYFRL